MAIFEAVAHGLNLVMMMKVLGIQLVQEVDQPEQETDQLVQKADQLVKKVDKLVKKVEKLVKEVDQLAKEIDQRTDFAALLEILALEESTGRLQTCLVLSFEAATVVFDLQYVFQGMPVYLDQHQLEQEADQWIDLTLVLKALLHVQKTGTAILEIVVVLSLGWNSEAPIQLVHT